MIRNFILVLFSVFTLSSCYQDIYKAYYVGDGGSMYFIFPVVYESDKRSGKIEFDYTISELKDTVRVNFNVVSMKSEKVESMNYLIDNQRIELVKLERILFDKRRNWFITRYTSSITTKEMKMILEHPKSLVQFNNDDLFSPSKKAISHLKDFNTDVMHNLNMP